MRNKLSDLNDYLFMQIERLDDETLEGDKLKQEIERVDKIVNVANAVIDNGNLMLKACIAAETHMIDNKSMLLLTGEETETKQIQQEPPRIRKK